VTHKEDLTKIIAAFPRGELQTDANPKDTTPTVNQPTIGFATEERPKIIVPLCIDVAMREMKTS
jgi:hypothetical protein